MICASCNSEFEPKKPNQKFCCAKCRKQAFQARHAVDQPASLGLPVVSVNDVPKPAPALVSKAGRPSKLTDEVQNRICGAIRMGCYTTIACKQAGISIDTLSAWRKRGEAGEEKYASFLQELEQAELDSEVELVRLWRTFAPKDFRACRDMLARRHGERWGREVESVEYRPGNTSGLHIHIDLGDDDPPPSKPVEQPQTLDLTEVLRKLPIEGDPN